jgi:hypothetical protein
MAISLNKQKLLEALKGDVLAGQKKRDRYDLNDPREAIIHHICKDEVEYAQTIIAAIEAGDYDEVI